ncbi:MULTISPECIES: hypothetical protein [unclassified Streptococcus]|uniref:hypothetical protein n=1 Tax=unclassified Streptococcus TaxID=2608887 RepID=UPI00359E1E43
MFKDIMCFVTYFISAVILLATSFIIFHFGTPSLPMSGDGTGLVLIWVYFSPRFLLPVTSLVLSLIFFRKARKSYQKLS